VQSYRIIFIGKTTPTLTLICAVISWSEVNQRLGRCERQTRLPQVLRHFRNDADWILVQAKVAYRSSELLTFSEVKSRRPSLISDDTPAYHARHLEYKSPADRRVTPVYLTACQSAKWCSRSPATALLATPSSTPQTRAQRHCPPTSLSRTPWLETVLIPEWST